MTRQITIALTETKNAYANMPARLEDLPSLVDRLDDIRRANVEHHIALMHRAKARGVSIIGFGELFPAPYFAKTKLPMWLAMAESAEDGPTVNELSAAARELAMVVVAPIYEHDPRVDRRFNTAVVIDDSGAVLGKYRKTHIPNGRNEQGEFNELFYYGCADGSAPEYFPIFETRHGRIGVSTCYDRHFEGVIRTLKKNGAELIFSPAVTFGAKSEHLWEMEFEVDAARNQVFIAGSNRLGSEPPFDQLYFGKSHVVGPNGRIADDRSEPGLVIATVDLDVVSQPDPSGWKLLVDRRPEIYRR